MLIEWLRRNNAKFDEQLRRFLFTTGSIVGEEHGRDSAVGDGSLGLGKLSQSSARSITAQPEKDQDDESSA